MTIGEKIKKCRLERSITQSELVGDRITRNMLSAIESGKASPSLETVSYIAERLELPLGYLLSNEDDLSFYRKNQMIAEVKDLLSKRKYLECIDRVSEIGALDDELSYILATCYYELAVYYAKVGSFESATSCISLCEEFCQKTVYDTSKYKLILPVYASFVNNINAPLLEFDKSAYYESMCEFTDYEFFNYLTGVQDFPYRSTLFKMHIEAKRLIKDRRYTDAIELLLKIENDKQKYEYNVYLMFGVYADLDNCYKQICDFENAYRYASKRLSLLEGFNS